MRLLYGALMTAALASVVLLAQDRRARFQSGIDLITVTATVLGPDGQLVTGLPRDAFEIFEDGERQTITQFSNERVPIGLAVLLDVSDSMFGQRLVESRTAVERFLFELLAKEDEFTVIAFNHEPLPLTDWTQTPEAVRGAMKALRPSGSTALYDALLTALPMMDTRTKPRAAILIISDGADTASDASLRDVRSALVRSDTFVYAIAIDPPARRAINEAVNVAALNELTGGNGGNTEIVHETAGLMAAMARIAEELNSQYVLGYHTPRPADGKYRTIRVRVTTPGHRVRARRGYIAEVRSKTG